MTIGQVVRSFLLKLDWYESLFPRIPVPIQKDVQQKLQDLNLCDDRKRKADEGGRTVFQDDEGRTGQVGSGLPIWQNLPLLIRTIIIRL